MNSTGRTNSGVAAGFLTLLIAMGIGRFLYTPLLPLMMSEYGFRADQAGLLASLNYVGYLVGAFSAGPLCHRYSEFRILAAGLLLSCITTAATGFFKGFAVVSASRFVAGGASALAFVAVSGLVLMILARQGREALAGLYYGGVGAGIAFTALAAPPVARVAGAAGTWIIFGIVGAALAVLPLLLLRRHDGPQHRERAEAPRRLPWSPPFLRIVASYGLEGFGYIITGTFMVAAANATVGASGARLAWFIAGCAALPSAFIWSQLARKRGRIQPLLAAYLLQAMGIVLPAVFSGAAALVVGAFLYGATFMGIVTLALSEGVSFAPAARARIVGFMTGVYGIGQILGPAVAGYVSARTGSYDLAVIIATAAVLAAAVLILPDAGRKKGEGSSKRIC
jgi:predicted MFS family arabinose efflux permease